MIVRLAQPDDSAAIAALYLELVDNPQVQVLPERLATLAEHADHALLVAEAGGRIVGTAHLMFCLDAMFGLQPYALVENVVVAAAARGQGVGKVLMDAIEARCRDRTCSKIMLLSSATRSDAHRFFARAGFQGDVKRGFVKYRRDFAMACETGLNS